jgi:hypothetical protein
MAFSESAAPAKLGPPGFCSQAAAASISATGGRRRSGAGVDLSITIWEACG